MDTASEKETRRAAIESEHNGIRDAREKEYTAAKVALEEEYLADLEQIKQDKREAFVAEGLNSDGSDPQDRQQGLQT